MNYAAATDAPLILPHLPASEQTFIELNNDAPPEVRRKQIAYNIDLAIALLQRWRTGNEADRAIITTQLDIAGIVPLYDERLVDLVWSPNPSLGGLPMNVVRVNALTVPKYGAWVPHILTGTSVYIGIPDLDGRVILTAGHCVEPNGQFSRWTSPGFFTGGGPNMAFYLGGEPGNIYLSVTPEFEPHAELVPLVNSLEQHSQQNKVIRVYVWNDRDVAMLITERSIYPEGSGLSGERITPDNTGKPATFDWKIIPTEVEGKMYQCNRLVFSDESELDYCDVRLIGYGAVGSRAGGTLDAGCFGTVYEAARLGLLDKRQQFLRLLGWGTKKMVQPTLDPHSCLYDLGSAGGGFSGSLILKGGEDKTFLGMYSDNNAAGVQGEDLVRIIEYVRQGEIECSRQ
jgi:hypothetical protein